VGEEKPWNLGRFYGTSYHVDPRGQMIDVASEYDDELLISEFDLDMIDEVRSTW
jgi:N-carbamoylputrescine amidase